MSSEAQQQLTAQRRPRRSRQGHGSSVQFCVSHSAFASLSSNTALPGPSQPSHPSTGSPSDVISSVQGALQGAIASTPFRLPWVTDESASQQPRQATDTAGPKHWASPPWLRLGGAEKQPQGGPDAKRNTLRHTATPDESAPALVCVEVTNGRKRTYHRKPGSDGGEAWDMMEAAHTARTHVLAVLRSYFLPQGFPESVAPQYASYMSWRGIQYFFGGAMSVYTTKSLLSALGVAGRYSGEASAAINWVIKDGAGRLGRLLFARWGRELDCELKQFRLAGDLLMEGGAALELATIWAPKAFLPLACTANLAKNLAAVAASATRAPIYRTFALQNNLADITAKGESVANLADILGTVAGIMLSRMHGLPLFPTFCCLSVGYLLASRREVDSVELPYLNRARLGYCQKAFLTTGAMPGVAEANNGEPLLPGQGWNNGRVILGSTLEGACHSPADLKTALNCNPHGQKYIITYRPDQNKAHVLLREGATTRDCLKGSFAAYLFLYLLDGHPLSEGLPHGAVARGAAPQPPAHEDWHMTLTRATKVMDLLYPEFVRQSEKLGWNLSQTTLNPRETRILQIATPLL